MTVNITNIKTRINELIETTSLTPSQITQFNYIINNYDSVAENATVASVSDLPDPIDKNVGRMVYIADENSFVRSDGTAWQYVSKAGGVVPAVSNMWHWGQSSTYDGKILFGPATSPTTVWWGGTDWGQISIGHYHNAVIKTDGTLWLWGYNVYGALGDGANTNQNSPVTTAGGGNTWSQISVGDFHTAAIKNDGTLWTWGLNGYGALGDGTSEHRSSPGTTAGGGTDWSQVACGERHNAAIKSDGTLWTWGHNNAGQLGVFSFIQYLSSPATVTGGGTDWEQVSAGGNTTAAIKTDGTLWTWGSNENGQLGDGTTNFRSSPGTTVGGGTDWKEVNVSGWYTSAIKTDGTLWTWGSNENGQLGDGTTNFRSSPGTTLGGGTDWSQVSAKGTSHAVAIKTDGTLWTWGRNEYGQLGDGTTTRRSSPGTTLGGGTNWIHVSAGGFYTLAVQL